MEVESQHFLSCNRCCFSTQARSRKPAKTSKPAAAASSSQRGSSKNKKAVVPDFPKLKSEYGVDAWRRWIKWRKTQPDLEKPRYGCKSVLFLDPRFCAMLSCHQFYPKHPMASQFCVRKLLHGKSNLLCHKLKRQTAVLLFKRI